MPQSQGAAPECQLVVVVHYLDASTSRCSTEVLLVSMVPKALWCRSTKSTMAFKGKDEEAGEGRTVEMVARVHTRMRCSVNWAWRAP
eukprot:scaffold114722_cov22-Tisochrysis_lutea.AAC.2